MNRKKKKRKKEKCCGVRVTYLSLFGRCRWHRKQRQVSNFIGGWNILKPFCVQYLRVIKRRYHDFGPGLSNQVLNLLIHQKKKSALSVKQTTSVETGWLQRQKWDLVSLPQSTPLHSIAMLHMECRQIFISTECGLCYGHAVLPMK